MSLLSRQEIDMIRGKMLAGVSTQQEHQHFLEYVAEMESLVEEASMEDVYGTEGWD